MIDIGHVSQPVAIEVQRSLSESCEITRLCLMLCRTHDNQRAGILLKQQVSMDHQIGNATCVRFFPQSDIMCLRHQSSAMCIIRLGEKTHTRGLQRKEVTHTSHYTSRPVPKETTNKLLIPATIPVER